VAASSDVFVTDARFGDGRTVLDLSLMIRA
jgi:hypothetical protein